MVRVVNLGAFGWGSLVVLGDGWGGWVRELMVDWTEERVGSGDGLVG